MPILNTDNGVEVEETKDVDLATADEHEEVAEVTKTKVKKPAKVKAKKATKAAKAAVKTKAATSKAPTKKPAAKAPVKVAKTKAATKVAKVKPRSGSKARGKKRGWPTGVAKNGRPARERVLKLLKQRLSPVEVARKVGVTPQRVYQIRKTA